MDEEFEIPNLGVLEPAKEGKFKFMGKEINTATMANGQGYVSLKSLCEAFALNLNGQRQRLNRTRVFKSRSSLVYFTTSSGRQPMVALNAYAVPAFLMGVETDRVASDETRSMLEVFQEEGMVALAEHFGLAERGEINFLREALSRMIAEQDEFENQLLKNVEQELADDRKTREEQIGKIREAFRAMREQIRMLERVAGPKLRITPEQVGQVRQTVMVLGNLRQRAGISAKPWSGIYGDLTMQFGFSRVDDITQQAFPKVLEFLDSQIAFLREGILAGRYGTPPSISADGEE
jgi:hypothetical protein